MQELYHRLRKDLRAIGIRSYFELVLKPYSKLYFGRYDPNKNRVTMYVYKDSDCTVKYDYEDLLSTLIHEAVHCMQWSDPDFVRYRGIMHDSEFYRLFNMYKNRAQAYLLLKEVRYDSTIIPICANSRDFPIRCFS